MHETHCNQAENSQTKTVDFDIHNVYNIAATLHPMPISPFYFSYASAGNTHVGGILPIVSLKCRHKGARLILWEMAKVAGHDCMQPFRGC